MLDRQRKIIIAYLLADSLLQLTTIDLEIMYELRPWPSFVFGRKQLYLKRSARIFLIVVDF